MEKNAAGYSGTPLPKKLGIKTGSRVAFIDEPQHYGTLLGELPTAVEIVERPRAGLDLVHAFFRERAKLEAGLPTLKELIKPNGAIWISWPKKSSKVPTDISEDTVRAVALPLDLVDIKVCAVDEVWSGLKLVIRVGKR